MSKRGKRFIPGIGWVKPKPGYKWSLSGKAVRPIIRPNQYSDSTSW